MSLILTNEGRGVSYDVVILDASGDVITPGDSDQIRAIIGREGETPKLTVTSGSDTANGSSFTKGATNRLRLDASDLEFSPGVYTMYVDFFDAADANEWKSVERQCFFLLGV